MMKLIESVYNLYLRLHKMKFESIQKFCGYSGTGYRCYYNTGTILKPNWVEYIYPRYCRSIWDIKFTCKVIQQGLLREKTIYENENKRWNGLKEFYKKSNRVYSKNEHFHTDSFHKILMEEGKI